MKRTFLLLMSVCLMTSAHSQARNALTEQPKETNDEVMEPKTTTPKILYAQDTTQEKNSMPVLKFRNKGTYLGSTGKGDVYAMAPDNMPCLVPKSSGNMPVFGNKRKNEMPPLTDGQKEALRKKMQQSNTSPNSHS